MPWDVMRSPLLFWGRAGLAAGRAVMDGTHAARECPALLGGMQSMTVDNLACRCPAALQEGTPTHSRALLFVSPVQIIQQQFAAALGVHICPGAAYGSVKVITAVRRTPWCARLPRCGVWCIQPSAGPQTPR